MKKRNCPWGCGLALMCGGNNKNTCEKYGINGTDKDNRPSDEQIKQTRRKHRAQLEAARRAKKKNASS